MTRKSPYEHPVKAHTRKGRPVKRYRRGKGKKPLRVRRKRRVVTEVGVIKKVRRIPVEKLKKKFRNYRVTITHVDAPSETVLTPGKDYANAADRGMVKKKSPEPFKRVRIVGVI